MTADELARVTAERDAAVAALARVEALADLWATWGRELTDPVVPMHAGHLADVLRRALAGIEGDAGCEVAPAGIRTTCGCQVVTRTPRFGELPSEPTYALGKPCARHARDATPTDDDLREAIGRAKKAAETRAGESGVER